MTPASHKMIPLELDSARRIADFADDALQSGTAPVSLTVDQRRALTRLAQLVSGPISGMHPLAETLRWTVATDEGPPL